MDIAALVVLLIFFWLSMFFSGMETGMISIDRFHLEQEAKRDKNKKRLLRFLDKPNIFLGVTLVGNNIAIVVVSSVFAIYFAEKFPFSRSVSTLALSAAMLIFAEIIPKSYSRDHAEKLVSKFTPLLFTFYYILKPFVAIVNLISKVLSKLFHIDSSNRYSFLTREDLAIILSESSFDDSLKKKQKDMLEEVMEFNELTAKNVMTPRLDVVAIKNDTPLQKVIEIAQQEGYSRYPVYEKSVDNITGILLIYDLLKETDLEQAVTKDFVREALFVPETIDINALLKQMQQYHRSMAIVVDSFGGTAGLITTEDILEELVGEIEDEYDFSDSDETKVKQINENTFIVKGDVELDFLNDNFNTGLPQSEFETVAGLIIERLMRVPSKGAKIKVDGWSLEVMKGTGAKIMQVMMKKIH